MATLGQVRRLLEPDGLLCLLERAHPPAVRLVDECGRPGIWDRLEDAERRLFEARRRDLPGAMRADLYPSMLATAGFDVMVDETVEISVDLQADDTATRFAVEHLRRSHDGLAAFLAQADLDAMAGLTRVVSDGSHRRIGAIHATRKLLVAAPRRAAMPA